MDTDATGPFGLLEIMWLLSAFSSSPLLFDSCPCKISLCGLLVIILIVDLC
jgi:hypothetical protein